MVHWRKWLRILHRDIGYIATGLTVIYSISGIAVNHVQDWNPNYVITKTTTKINPVPDSLVSSGNLVGFILKKIGETGKLKNSFYPDSTSVKIFVEGNTITANLKTGEVLQEKIKS